MTDRKIRFALIGSGWRTMYYVRIAKALPLTVFSLRVSIVHKVF